MERDRPSNDWYRRRIELSQDFNYEVGPPSGLLQTAQHGHDYAAGVSTRVPQVVAEATPLTTAFGALVKLERRNKRLSQQDLARELDVDVDEVRLIENDPTYRARPRTILIIAKYFTLPMKQLMKLAGAAAASNDGVFQDKALRFAARSDGLEGLSPEERELLQDFVRFIRGGGRRP